MPPSQLPDTQPVRPVQRRRSYAWIAWVLFAVAAFLALGSAGAYAGYRAGIQEQRSLEATQGVLSVHKQFDQGLQDLQSGQLELARQRFEWVLVQDPTFPGAADRLSEVMAILFATATPTPLPATPTLTPTPDLRPVEDLVNQIKSLFTGGDWTGAIDTVVNLRKVDPGYRVAEIDGLLYLALRNRGVDKIRGADLGGGTYDLALAERIGPLDAEAYNFRELARLYMLGSSFWEAYPEQAVYYFAQVAAAAPGLKDASGWTARERYRAVLIQYGDQLARGGDWCAAQTQYALAISIREDANFAATAIYAEVQCYTPTPPATATPTETPTPTGTATFEIPTNTPALEWTATPSETPPVIPFTNTPETPTPPVPTETATSELLPTATETPTLEPVLPSETPTPPALLSATETESPPATPATDGTTAP